MPQAELVLTCRVERHENVFLSRIVELDISTYADDLAQVVELTIEMLTLHFRTCRKLGTLTHLLRELMHGEVRPIQQLTLNVLSVTADDYPTSKHVTVRTPELCAA